LGQIKKGEAIAFSMVKGKKKSANNIPTACL